MFAKISNVILLSVVAATLVGCGKDGAGPGKPASSVSAAPAVKPPGDAGVDASAASTSVGKSWVGSYDATEGTLHVPEGKEWAGVKFRGDKSDVGLGKGTMSIDVDARGTLIGTLDGPLGPAVVSGSIDKDGNVSARVDPKTPSETAFYGTFSGKRDATGIEGVMRLSQAEARVIREAKVSLKAK